MYRVSVHGDGEAEDAGAGDDVRDEVGAAGALEGGGHPGVFVVGVLGHSVGGRGGLVDSVLGERNWKGRGSVGSWARTGGWWQDTEVEDRAYRERHCRRPLRRDCVGCMVVVMCEYRGDVLSGSECSPSSSWNKCRWQIWQL